MNVSEINLANAGWTPITDVQRQMESMPRKVYIAPGGQNCIHVQADSVLKLYVRSLARQGRPYWSELGTFESTEQVFKVLKKT